MEFVQGFLEKPEKTAVPPAEVEEVVKEQRKTYATLLCNESYFNGVCVLVKTIKKHCSGRFPITVLVDQANVSRATIVRLKGMVDFVIEVDTLLHDYKKPTSATADATSTPWAASEMTKLRLWDLHADFDKVVYVDADCMLLDCIDELFERCSAVDFAAAPDVFPPDKFNAGVLVLKPDATVFRDMCSRLSDTYAYDGGDTGVLNAYYPEWYSGSVAQRLPFGYNMQRTMYWFTYQKRPGYWDIVQPKKIVHFSSSPKPWEMSMAAAKGDLELQWWLTLMS